MEPASLRVRYPEVLERLDRVSARADEIVDPILLSAMRDRIDATLMGSPPGESPGADPRVRACCDLVDQMLLDVSSVTDEQVERVAVQLPPGAVADLVTAAYVHEARSRLEIAAARLLGEGGSHG